MALVVSNDAEQTILEMAIKSQDLVLRLYTNSSLTLAETITAASFTEMAGNGYAAKTLTAANWVVTQGGPTQISYAQQTYSFTGAAGTAYGYFVTRSSDGKLMWAESFASQGGPYTVTGSSDTIKVTPQFTAE